MYRAVILGWACFAAGVLCCAVWVSARRDRVRHRPRRAAPEWRLGPVTFEGQHCRVQPAPPTTATSSSPRLVAVPTSRRPA